MQKTVKHSLFLIPGIVLLGAVLRIPITTIPPVLDSIAKGLHVPVSSLGILTTLPLLAFAIFSPVAPWVARKLGNEGAFAAVLVLMIVGSIIRIISTPMMFLGTLLVGIGIAFMNVLLPTLISANFPTKVGLYTSVYVFTMGLTTAGASALAVPIVKATSWQTLIIILTIAVVIALIVWLPNLKYNQRATRNSASKAPKVPSAWKNKTAWLMLVFAGIQSAIFYTSIAWLPTIATGFGLSGSMAGLLAGINALVTLPVSFLVPNFVTGWNKKNRQIFLIVASAFAAISYIMIFFGNASFGFWLVLNILNGLATGSLFPYLMASLSNKTKNPYETSELSGMVNSGGYLIAAIGPALFGTAYSAFHSCHRIHKSSSS
ncbi:MFS transporter [Periweissella cryptocerci]|uniref:MFS transporter n=1 Tax=Periweissella cryptocerci TaxID=2506420 RepID=UPI0026958EBC